MRALVLLSVIALVGCRTEPDKAGAGDTTTVAGPDTAFTETPLGDAARRGLAILMATRDSLPNNVGNALRCTSCHLDEGRRPFAMTWVGVYGRYPQYRSRSASVQVLEDRINDCLERSLAGKSLAHDDDRMRAMVAYMALISRGSPVGGKTQGQGIDSVKATTPNVKAGEEFFASTCVRCHGAGGEGATFAPPVWGDRSFTIGAGMGRYLTAAGFIRRNMPFDQPGSLTDQQALDVAAYIDSRPRRDFPGKERDWPKGGAPKDVPYQVMGSR